MVDSYNLGCVLEPCRGVVRCGCVGGKGDEAMHYIAILHLPSSL